MKKYIQLFLLLALISCSGHKDNKFVYNEFTWMDQFKESVFRACIKESYRSDSIYEQMSKKDIFFANDALYGELELINRLGEDFVKKIPLPKRPCPECKREDKYFMANCLKYYKSKELDSIAKLEYKIFLKQFKSEN